ncbi:MAG: BREX-1 system adenine-specific DNA-methyltransferase PglX, partial [Deltaproteobacteria bacterium]|nr:BREX-1 system adenine-specific DNA-methyltransferase PglX [Deltaproteobacteria bacterium]
LASRLFPRHRALSQLIEKMNASELEEAWEPGNEETIGWIYQYYNEPDLEIFRGNSSLKVPPHLVAPRTQQFTPRWVVKFLVHNTIGRLWVEMHPDSSIVEILGYLVPFDNETPEREVKPVSEITVLDPACGTMHFGLVAFDLFSFMYREEMERAGDPGWPEKPSVNTEKEIASAILANNIFGIDIDLRSVQLSALTLLLKAKMLNPEVEILETNLTCADIVLLNSDKLGRFLEEMAFDRPIYGRLIKETWKILKDANEFGSLLRPEKEIQKLIEEEKKQLKKDLPMFPDKERYADAYSGDDDFWALLDAQIVQAFDEFMRQYGDKDLGTRFFSNEAIKGFKLLNIMMQRFDVVITNPPYLDSGDYNPNLKQFLGSKYPQSKRNLYSACIERFLEFLNDDGRLGIITGQSFMFISSFEGFRKDCLRNNLIENLIQFHYGLFSARVDTAAFILRRELGAKERDNTVGIYFRLIKEPDSESKRKRFEKALGRIKNGDHEPLLFRYLQADFNSIPGSPWVYWLKPAIRDLFSRHRTLGSFESVKEGINTGDNERFIRFWWEVASLLGFDATKKYVPFCKGGPERKYYDKFDECVLNDLLQMRPLSGSRIFNTEFSFRQAIAFLSNSSTGFRARFIPDFGRFCSTGGRAVFPKNIQIFGLLGILNSKFCDYLLKLINPTISIKVGDLNSLPIIRGGLDYVGNLTKEAVSLQKSAVKESEMSFEFIGPPAWETGVDDVAARNLRLADVECNIDEAVYRLYGISDKDRSGIEAEISGRDFIDSEPEDTDDEEKQGNDDQQSASPLSRDSLARQWINYSVGVVMGRFDPGVEKALGRGRFSAEAAAQLRNLADPDAILVMDEGHTDDLLTKVFEALSIMLGDKAASEVVKSVTDKEGPSEELLRQYLDRQFFKLHIQQYRKRPVYWFFQSPKKKYGVWVFHERLNNDSLFRIRTEYVEPKINLLDSQIAELKEKRDGAEGREKRALEKEIGNFIDVLDDVREFSKRLEFIIEDRGYVPHIDDGVLLNMAPLWELIPSWQKEPKKAWEALERGDYDWSYQAMDHWPDRVKEKCKTNKSYAIAHGME